MSEKRHLKMEDTTDLVIWISKNKAELIAEGYSRRKIESMIAAELKLELHPVTLYRLLRAQGIEPVKSSAKRSPQSGGRSTRIVACEVQKLLKAFNIESSPEFKAVLGGKPLPPEENAGFVG